MNNALIQEIENLCTKDKATVICAANVYLELCEVKKYYDLTIAYDKDVDIIYISARRSKSQPISFFIPLPSSKPLSFARLSSILKSHMFGNQNIYVALVSSDSTCVYYQITDGLGKPPSEETMKSVENKKENLDANFRNHRALIEEAALCGLLVTIPSVLPSTSKSDQDKLGG